MKDPGSFRDPSGFIYHENGKVLRIVNKSYKENYDHLINSGLYKFLKTQNKIIPHSIFSSKKKYSSNQYKVLEMKKINSISYPYEWCFSQFKAAALRTLEIQKIAINYNMSLKDATPYNIQFIDNSPVFIDTLSFEIVKGNYFWKPYKQFCEMFLGPLCLMSYKDPRLSKMLITFINGIPIDLVNKILSFKSKLNPSVFFHLVLQNILSSSKSKSSSNKIISKKQHLSIISQLYSFIKNLNLKIKKTEWGRYYTETKNEKIKYLIHKEKTIYNWLKQIKFNVIWDIGSNDGNFSKLVSKFKKTSVYSLDFDWKCVETNYNNNLIEENKNITALLVDLVNPSPSIGWNNMERKSIFQRLETPNLIMALALVHHIINLNIPIDEFINLLSKTEKYVIFEYVPITDPKCQEIFKSRGEDFDYIDEKNLLVLLEQKFKILKSTELNETKRKLYLLEKN